MVHRKKAVKTPKASSKKIPRLSSILIVEDEPTQAAVIRRIVRDAYPNVKVKAVRSLREYRSALASVLPDIVLMDINLTDGKAFEVLTSPLEAGSFPVVVMTGYGNEKVAVKAMKKGAIDYVVKSPETLKSIPRTLERALRAWKLIQERKRAEEALHESELRFYTLYENVTIGLYRTTPAGKILLANRALVKMLGYSSFEQLTERNLSKFGFERTSQRKGFLRKIELDCEVHDFESTWIRQDGSLLIVRESARAVRDSSGKTVYYDGTAEDVTERRLAEVGSRHAEDAVRESEEKFRSITENLNDVVFLTDVKGIITYISPAVQRLFGCTSESMQGHFFGEYLDETELPRVIPLFEAAIRNGIPAKNLPLLAKRKDGKTFQAELDASHLVKDGKLLGTIGVIKDISERKQAEKALRESEYFFKESQYAANIGSYKTDFIAGVWESSEVLDQIFGIDQNYNRNIEGWLDVVHPDDREMMNRYLREEVIPMHTLFNKEYKIIRKSDHEVRWVHGLGEIDFDVKGNIISMIGTIQDITERKHAEKALQEISETLRTLIQSSPLAIIAIDPDGDVTLWNPAAEQMFGWREREIMGQALPTITDDQREEHRAIREHVLGGNALTNMEVRRRKKDGSLIDISISIAPLRNAQGQVTGMMSVSADITDRKRVEGALRNSEEKFRKAFMTSPDSININRLTDGAYISINQGFTRILGYTEEDILGKTSLEKNIWDDPGDRKKLVEGLTRDGVVENLVARFRSKTGEIKYGMMSASVIELGGVPHILNITRDITERRQIEEALRSSEEKYRLLFKNNPAPMWVFDADSLAFLAVNDFAVDHYGYSREEFLSMTIKDIRPHEDIPYLEDVLRKNTNQLRKVGTARHRRKNGSLIDVEVTGHEIDFEGHRAIFVLAMDITERKQAEEAMRQMQKLEGLGTLAGGIAHDFNNILGIILGYTEIIKQYKEDPKKFDFSIETITKAVDRGKTLVQQVLTFARKTDTTFGPVNVNDVVMEILTMIMETFPKVLTYSQNFEKGLPYVNADRSQLHQALLNLCVNARDAMRSGGIVTLNTCRISGKRLQNQYPDALESDYICIEVIDTGEGMSREIRNRIFEPFFTTKEQGKGTGLGLAVVFGVVQSHKGFIDVESERGKGTTFRIYLPAMNVTVPVSVNDEEQLEEIPGGTETLLVVEDEEMLLVSLKMVLAEKGYNVLSAGDGLTALNLYQERRDDIAVVLTDLGLPTMTGMDECAQIKKINPNARMIVATGFLDPEMKSEFLKAGIRHFLYKPYDFIKVLKVIREVLDET
ncbi:MAG: PAS domain S-box protein [Ignavibacteriae bacterium]|nr:MAG: PAS domain S-box protein [Ignavibacteriota bacterium]